MSSLVQNGVKKSEGYFNNRFYLETKYINMYLFGLPKWSIQFNLAPKSKMTSALCRAKDLAGWIHLSDVSDTTPFPIGVARNGRFVLLISSLTYISIMYFNVCILITSGYVWLKTLIVL